MHDKIWAHSNSPVVDYDDDRTESDGVNEKVDDVIEVVREVARKLSQDGTE